MSLFPARVDVKSSVNELIRTTELIYYKRECLLMQKPSRERWINVSGAIDRFGNPRWSPVEESLNHHEHQKLDNLKMIDGFWLCTSKKQTEKMTKVFRSSPLYIRATVLFLTSCHAAQVSPSDHRSTGWLALHFGASEELVVVEIFASP